MSNDCPTSPSGKHILAGSYADVKRVSDFEPVQYGAAATDTLYKRVEYSISTCQCGYSQKRKIKHYEEN
jgi:hypothetical protein